MTKASYGWKVVKFIFPVLGATFFYVVSVFLSECCKRENYKKSKTKTEDKLKAWEDKLNQSGGDKINIPKEAAELDPEQKEFTIIVLGTSEINLDNRLKEPTSRMALALVSRRRELQKDLSVNFSKPSLFNPENEVNWLTDIDNVISDQTSRYRDAEMDDSLREKLHIDVRMLLEIARDMSEYVKGLKTLEEKTFSPGKILGMTAGGAALGGSISYCLQRWAER